MRGENLVENRLGKGKWEGDVGGSVGVCVGGENLVEILAKNGLGKGMWEGDVRGDVGRGVGGG